MLPVYDMDGRYREGCRASWELVKEEDKPSLKTKTSGEQRERKKCQKPGKQRRNGEIATK